MKEKAVMFLLVMGICLFGTGFIKRAEQEQAKDPAHFQRKRKDMPAKECRRSHNGVPDGEDARCMAEISGFGSRREQQAQHEHGQEGVCVGNRCDEVNGSLRHRDPAEGKYCQGQIAV